MKGAKRLGRLEKRAFVFWEASTGFKKAEKWKKGGKKRRGVARYGNTRAQGDANSYSTNIKKKGWLSKTWVIFTVPSGFSIAEIRKATVRL